MALQDETEQDLTKHAKDGKGAKDKAKDEARRGRDRTRKRKMGIIKKSEQMRRTCPVEVEVSIFDHETLQLTKYESMPIGLWPSSDEKIKQDLLPTEAFSPDDFITDDENIQKDTPRKRIPDIRLRSKRQKIVREPHTGGRAATSRGDSPSSPPPQLPDSIKDMALRYAANTGETI